MLDFKTFDGKYPKEERVGEGSCGAIYSSGRFVIKVIPSDDENIDSFYREIDSYSHVNHPCLLSVENYSFDDKNNTFLFSLLKGIDIVLAYRSGIITLRQIISDLIDALKHLHSGYIAHCDIKPKN